MRGEKGWGAIVCPSSPPPPHLLPRAGHSRFFQSFYRTKIIFTSFSIKWLWLEVGNYNRPGPEVGLSYWPGSNFLNLTEEPETSNAQLCSFPCFVHRSSHSHYIVDTGQWEHTSTHTHTETRSISGKRILKILTHEKVFNIPCGYLEARRS